MARLEKHPARAAKVEPSLVPYLISISKRVRQLSTLKLAECGVVAGQDQYLLCFREGEAVPVVSIAERLLVRASTVSKMTDILQRKGWVERETDGEDGRRVLVHLTKEGLKIRDAVRTIEASLEAELLAALEGDANMLPCLSQLDDVLTQRLRRLR